MRLQRLLLGIAAGGAAGYALVRAFEACAPPAAAQTNAARYGKIRRGLAVADVLRSSAASVAFAYGPMGERISRIVEPLPRWLRPGAFAALATAGGAISEFPVDLAQGYRIERRFGLTEQTMASYLSDAAKSAALETALAAALATAAAALLRRFPRSWPAIASASTLGLYALANIIVPVYVLPLFNRFERLDGPLEERLRSLASRFDVGDAEILTMNMSKQTKKANAFVAGIGSTHRIVLGDTLVEHFEPEEIEFIIAHELGHYVTRDTWRLIGIAAGSTALLLVIVANVTARDRSSESLRVARIGALLGLGAQVLRPALSAFSRSREWAADRFAMGATRDPRAGVAAFERLRDQNLAEDDVPDWYEFFFGTHPSLGKRIAELRAQQIDERTARDADKAERNGAGSGIPENHQPAGGSEQYR